jgi:hypothetical protein
VDLSLLENYITRYGWTYERYEEVVVAGVETDAGNFAVAFQLGPPWLRLSVPAIAPGQDRSLEFYTLLLHLNDRSRMARFTLDEADNVVLCIDLYLQPSLEFAQFEFALDVLAYIAETALPHLAGELTEPEEETEDE